MKLLTRDDIFAASDLQHEDIPVPEWGGSIRLRQLDAEALMQMTADMLLPENKDKGMFIILTRCAVDNEMHTIFTEADIERLRKKNMRVMDRLQRLAMLLNSMDPEAGVAIKKALSEAATAASPTDSLKSLDSPTLM